jgi:hypothetical protein
LSSPTKVPDAPPIEDLDNGLRTVTATIKGTRYVLRELEMIEYERELKRAEGPDGRVDNVLLLKFMVLKSLQEPKLDAEQLGHKGTSVVRKLNDIVNEIHFADVESDEEKAEREAAEAEHEGEALGARGPRLM